MDTAAATRSSQPDVTATTTPLSLDTRGMEPPLPILAILKKLGELAPSQTLEVRLDNLPMQLYDLLQQRGFQMQACRQPDGAYDAQVAPRDLATFDA